MKVSLRKANAIQSSIQETLKSLDLETTVSLNEFENAADTLVKAKEKFNQTYIRRVDLIQVQHRIRAAVGRANVECGISDKLATAAMVDRMIVELTQITNANDETEYKQVEARLEKIRNNPETGMYGIARVVVTSVVGEAQKLSANASLKTMKKEKQQLNDEILELNIKTEIELNEDIVNILMSEGLI